MASLIFPLQRMDTNVVSIIRNEYEVQNTKVGPMILRLIEVSPIVIGPWDLQKNIRRMSI